MLLGKAAILLLLVFAIVSLDPVSGCCKKGPCTKQQKKDILNVCHIYIVKENHSRRAPRKEHDCCKDVITLQTKNKGMMQCIVDLLTLDEDDQYDATLMLDLVKYCAPSTTPLEVMI